jgi:wyosine [tRNA(Phe)-imidazoG37] synthetase (radical SAM superfamily)
VDVNVCGERRKAKTADAPSRQEVRVTASTIPLQGDWVYGPVTSRRLGRSLGVNLLPTGRKVCNLDCVYCQYANGGDDSALPTARDVLGAVERALKASVALDRITIAGNGEPTLHPHFLQIVEGLAALRDRAAPGVELCLLSNAARIRFPMIRKALRLIDRPILKLDAGDQETYQRVNRPQAGTLAQVLPWLRATPRLELQSMFIQGVVDNTSPEHVARWLELVGDLRPGHVQVTTVDRGTQTAGVLPVPAPRLEEIATAVHALGIEADVYAWRDESKFA